MPFGIGLDDIAEVADAVNPFYDRKPRKRKKKPTRVPKTKAGARRPPSAAASRNTRRVTPPDPLHILPEPMALQVPKTKTQRRREEEKKVLKSNVKSGLKMTPQKRLENFGFLGASYLQRVENERDAYRAVIRSEREAREKYRSKKDDFFGWGGQLERVKAAGSSIGSLSEKAYEDLVEWRKQKRGMGLLETSLTMGIGYEVPEMLGKMVMGVPAGVYGMRHPGRAPRDIANQASSLVQIPGLLVAAANPATSKAARERLLTKVYEENKRGLLDLYGPDVSWSKSFSEQEKMPVSSFLTGASLVGGPIARGASFATGLKAAKAAGLSGPEARRLAGQSVARPYLLGPDYERTLRLRGGPAGRGRDVTIEYARHPLWRPLQRAYDQVSRRVSQTTPGLRTISEPVRAARATKRGHDKQTRRDLALADIAMSQVASLTKAEQSRIMRTRDKPAGVPDDVWLTAMINEMQDMLGGREVIQPSKRSPAVERLQSRIAYLEKRRDAAIERRVDRVVADQIAPLTARSTSLRGQIRERRRKGESTDVLERELYEVNAQLDLARGTKVRPVRNSPEREKYARIVAEQLGQEKVGPLMQVTDALARAAEPDDPAKWYATRLADTSIGSAEEMTRLVAQGQVMFQRPGYQGNLAVRMNETDPQPGDIVFLKGGERGDAYVVTSIDGDDLSLTDMDGYPAGVISGDEVGGVINLPVGRKVVTRNGESGEIIGGDPERSFVLVRGDDGNTYEVQTQDIAPEHMPIFYSHAQRVIEEKGQPKATAEQWAKLMEKEGVKADEMEWAGINDFLELQKDAGVKSIPKDDMLRYLANPQNAFDLAEVLYASDGSYHFNTRWGPERGEGLVIRDDPDEYKELVMTLPGKTVFTHGHWSGLSNPLLHVRFHEVTETVHHPTSNLSSTQRKLVIDELQSDWHQGIQKYGAKEKGWEEVRDEINAEQRRLVERMDEIASKFGVTVQELNELNRRLANDFLETVGDAVALEETRLGRRLEVEEREIIHERHSSPERKAVQKALNLTQRLSTRKQTLQNQVYALERGIAPAAFGKNRWLDLAMKRMVAYAAREGFDRIEWVDGHTQAVRYELFHGGIDSQRYEYESPEDHPSFPDRDDYVNEYTHSSYELNAPPDAGEEMIQERLFGGSFTQNVDGAPVDVLQTWRGRQVTGRDGGAQTELIPGEDVRGVPMSQTQPLRLSTEEFDDFFHFGTAPGDYVTPNSGPFEGVHMKVVSVEGDDLFVVPTGVTRVEIGGTKGAGYGDQSISVYLYGADGKLIVDDYVDVSPNTYLAEALDGSGEEMISSLATQHWWDEVDGKYDRGWEPEIDEEQWNDAVNYFMEEYGHEIGESTGDHDFDDIKNMDDYDSSGEGVVRFYDEVLPSAVNKLFKKQGVTVQRGTVGGRYSSENSGVLTEWGKIDTFGFDVTPELKAMALAGQRLFQSAHHGNIKGATEFLGGGKTAMRLFESADVSTVLHELGHIALHDMDEADVTVLDREFAAGRSYKAGDWVTEDHERYARAWERYFLEGRASSTAVRGVFDKLMQWMKLIYTSARGLDVRISPEVEAVFNKRLGKVEMQEEDIVRYAGRFDKSVVRWGTLIANAKNELESLQARLNSMAENGTDEVLQEELSRLERQRHEAVDEDTWQEANEKIQGIEMELHERTLRRLARSERREKLLTMQLGDLEKALASERSPGYEMGVAAADFLQSDREAVIREILGDAFDVVFEGRQQQMSTWLAARGHLDPDMVGPGRGHFSFTRKKGASAAIGRSATPANRKFGKQSRAALNLSKRNEMILWQLGDYRADPKVLVESWSRAQAFKYNADLRQLLFDIGEDVGPNGPREGWYLVDPEGKPLPKEWESALTPDEIKRFFDDMEGDNDESFANRLLLFTRNWIGKEPADFVRPDGTYKGLRQVNPAVVHQLILPWQSGSPVRSLQGAADIVNSIARISLIYTSPGYIPSNVIANSILGLANSPWFLKDLPWAMDILARDGNFARLVEAEMGGGSLKAMLPERGIIKGAEEKLVDVLKVPADDVPRIAGWMSTARRNGYRSKAEMKRLLTSKDPKVLRDRDFIAREAEDVMLNFNRLSPMEKRYLQSILFVWPFLRAATAWPFTYLRDFPERAGLAIAATQGYGEEAREELGPTPSYYGAMVPISVDEESGVGTVANLSSVSPLGPLSDILRTAYLTARGLVSDEKVPAFDNLFGYIAPQYQAAVNLLQGQTSFGQEKGLRGIASDDFGDLVPGAAILQDILDESKPAIYLEQDLWNTLYRRLVRYSPQQVNMNVLNHQAEVRKVKTPEQKANALVNKARSSWSKAYPTETMPQEIVRSIRAFYAYSEARDELQEHIRKSGEWRPKRGEMTPRLTPLQETALSYDILNAHFPGTIEEYNLPDPEQFFRENGELATTEYGKRIRRQMFRLKERAQEAINKQKKAAAAGVTP